jgi:beta-lactamase class A
MEKLVIKMREKEKNIIFNSFISLLLIYGTLYCFKYINDTQNSYLNNTITTINETDDDISAYELSEYNDCLNKYYNSNDLSENIVNKINELNNYLSQYNTSIYYYDLTNGYSYKYNEDKVYYAASTIKMLDALYIYEMASKGQINLDDEIVYQKSNVISASKEMKKYHVGDTVSLRNLVKYAITVSDNSAHDMLIDYIGYNNLKAYGQSLGAFYTLNGTDNFGSITVSDAIDYLTELNNYINNNGSLGEELKSYFINGEQNYLDFPELNIYASEKYGEYNNFYHENGIIYDEHPYLISVLTTEGNNDKEQVIRDINSKIYELHKLFYSERENKCYGTIYAN